jgi:hypothetical protein
MEKEGITGMKNKFEKIIFLLIPAAMSCRLWAGTSLPVATAEISRSLQPSHTITSKNAQSRTAMVTETPTKRNSITPSNTDVITEIPNTPLPASGIIKLIYDHKYDDDHNPNAYVDLDTMMIGDTPKSDLRLILSIGSDVFVWLDAVNGAYAYSMGTESVTLIDCINSKSLIQRITIPQVVKGNHICMITNSQRIVLLRIVETIVTDDNTATMRLEYHM